MKVTLRWAYRDWFVGAAWERVPRRLLLFVLPTVCVVLHFAHRRCTRCGERGASIYQPWVHHRCEAKARRARTRRI